MNNQQTTKRPDVVGLDPVAAADALRERRAVQAVPLIVPGMMQKVVNNVANMMALPKGDATQTGKR